MTTQAPNPLSVCQHCELPVRYDTTEHGYPGFVHEANGLTECPTEANDDTDDDEGCCIDFAGDGTRCTTCGWNAAAHELALDLLRTMLSEMLDDAHSEGN